MNYLRIAWNSKNVTCNCMPNGFHFVLLSISEERSLQTYKKCWILSIFKRLCPFSQVFWQVKQWLMLELCEVRKVSHLAVCPIVFVFLYDRGRIAQTYGKWSVFSILNRSVHFLQVFGKSKEWLMLELHEMIRVLQVVAYKKFLAVEVLFLKFLGRLKSRIYWNCTKW